MKITTKKQATKYFMDFVREYDYIDAEGDHNKYYSEDTKCHYLSKSEARRHYNEYHRENIVIFDGQTWELDDLAQYMNDEIRESVHSTHHNAPAQKFFNLYKKLHKTKFKTEFVIN